MRLPSSLEVQASLDSFMDLAANNRLMSMPSERMARRKKQWWHHSAHAQIVEQLIHTGIGTSMSKRQLLSGAKTMLAMATRQARLAHGN